MTDLTATDLRAEQTVELLGTAARNPRLSWRLEAAARGVAQATYRIRASAEPDGPLLWDSGIVPSDACGNIAYGGPSLTSMQRVWWWVEVTDNRGLTARSAPTWFEAGLLEPADWRGAWLEAEDAADAAERAAGLAWVWSDTALDPRPHAFRLDLPPAADVERVEVLVSGKDHLRGVWIDGEPAALDQPWPYDTPLPFWGTLSPIVVPPGAVPRTICVLVQADVTGFFPVDGGALAALVRLHRRDGRVEHVVSGPQWRVCADPPAGWQAPGFDAGGWPAAVPSGAEAQNDPRPAEPVMHLQARFDTSGPVVAARLYATALGAYDASVNGRRVSDAVLSPEISVARRHIFYQTYDVTTLIADGANALDVLVGDGWYAGAFGWRIERYGFGPAPRRFRAQLRLDYADGSHQWVATGPDWRIAPSHILSSEIYDGETADARRQVRDWTPATVGADPGALLLPLTSPPLRPVEELRALSVNEPAPGRFVFDFGQNFSGWVRISAQGPAGTTVTARFAELLHPDGTADLANLRLARATDRFTLAGTGAAERLEPRFTYHGFRYVEVEGFPGTPGVEDVVGVVVHNDCRITGTIDFPQAPLLQAITRNALWSQKSNFFAVPTDCPQRDERMGWMGDIQVFADAAAFTMEVGPFLRRFLVEARAAQRPDGGYPIVVPQPLSYPDVTTAGWSEAGVILPWLLWQRYGDSAVIGENWQAMEAWMAHVAAHNPDGVWRHERGLDLGDWLSVDAVKPDDETTPRGLCATAYWAWCAELMADMAAATGRDPAPWRQLRTRIGAAFAAEYLRTDGTAGNGSQTSQVLALHMGLVPPEQRAAAARVLADDIRARGMKLSTGFLGTPYILDVLADAGLLEEVSGLLLQTGYPSWGYMVAQGATTMWERWNGDTGDLAMNSYNHYAFGAVVGFFWRRLAGIAPAAPGFRRIAVRPLWLPQVGPVAARYESVLGTIATRTDGDAQGLTALTLTVPPNSIAEVELPDRGTWLEGDRVLPAPRFTVPSGEYRFTLRD